ncbi:MAG: hypothetical protein LQ352_006258 [Teloschistes flavicans]|nr:MAG: hypothetical protein LQ352_006258 [Teloschistes flavicans]
MRLEYQVSQLVSTAGIENTSTEEDQPEGLSHRSSSPVAEDNLTPQSSTVEQSDSTMSLPVNVANTQSPVSENTTETRKSDIAPDIGPNTNTHDPNISDGTVTNDFLSNQSVAYDPNTSHRSSTDDFSFGQEDVFNPHLPRQTGTETFPHHPMSYSTGAAQSSSSENMESAVGSRMTDRTVDSSQAESSPYCLSIAQPASSNAANVNLEPNAWPGMGVAPVQFQATPAALVYRQGYFQTSARGHSNMYTSANMGGGSFAQGLHQFFFTAGTAYLNGWAGTGYALDNTLGPQTAFGTPSPWANTVASDPNDYTSSTNLVSPFAPYPQQYAGLPLSTMLPSHRTINNWAGVTGSHPNNDAPSIHHEGPYAPQLQQYPMWPSSRTFPTDGTTNNWADASGSQSGPSTPSNDFGLSSTPQIQQHPTAPHSPIPPQYRERQQDEDTNIRPLSYGGP